VRPDRCQCNEVCRSLEGEAENQMASVGVADREDTREVASEGVLSVAYDGTQESDLVNFGQCLVIRSPGATVVPLATQRIGIGDKETMLVSRSFESGGRETAKTLSVTSATMQRQHERGSIGETLGSIEADGTAETLDLQVLDG
jgi:hypothetical protein